MGNTLVIARKEFADLLSNRWVLIAIIALLIYVSSWAYDFYNVLNGALPGAQLMFQDNLGIAAINYVFFALCWFGSILGIVIGCSTISSERIGSALNTLTVKPVYRDTIINGKLLGSLMFITSVIVLFIAIYTAELFSLCGGSIAPFLSDYFSRLPFVFLFVMVFILVFFALSLLISLLVKDQSFAMILSTLTVYVSMKFATVVSANLKNLFPDNKLIDLVSSFSPYTLMWDGGLQYRFMDTKIGAWDAFTVVLPDFVRLLLLIVAVLFLSYTVFVRSDLS
ncbi:ABC transporter permease subunit [Methanocella sp. MCL-LM]|uniref:ABC transporter permease subunit n=1 Tax=Methanocella sp. MCL-LM TaxID=3412035 RepID=UPI003C779432